MNANDDARGELAEVALPVPLRKLFTYRVPNEFDEHVVPGARVAVVFNRRKLAGFVVRRIDEAPEGVKRLRSIDAVLDPEPIFPAELLRFLDQAARYYFHPLGEVLRAAGPALATGALRSLRDAGFLDAGESLPGRHVARRMETFASLVREDETKESSLGARQRVVLTYLEAREEVPLSEMRSLLPDVRSVLRRLERRGRVRLVEREVAADPLFGAPIPAEPPPEPNTDQARAIETLTQALHQGADGGYLLHGVTGSGKTEVYLRVIAEALALGRGSILLVPEIALTPQLVARFRARFGDSIAVLHSGLSEKERDAAWWALRRGSLRIAVGARSALFAPVADLGVIVVDEEHDPSFKQEEGFRYQARDMALLRAHRSGAIAILGSATPSIETMFMAEAGRLKLLRLPERATSQSLPSVEIVDLKRHREGPSQERLISGPLHRAIEEGLAAQGQAILFLNRRGFAPSLRCETCGEPLQCPACSVALTEHRRAATLRCHYCDFTTPVPERCPTCGGDGLERVGIGTERLEETLAEIFAPARVGRLDRDTASGRGVEELLDRLRRRELDILVGTQMVTKGHDIPSVTVVGVLLADQSLAFPDFRAAERTFQLLSQVAGRAGRGESHGHVVLQTFQPDHPAVALAATHDYLGFYRKELAARREHAYAPYSRLIAIRIDAGSETLAERAARTLAEEALRHRAVREGLVDLLGPAPAPIARIRGRFRYRLMLRSADRKVLRNVAALLVARIDEGLGAARATIDIDPVSML